MITYYYKNAHAKQLSVHDSYQKGSWVSVEKPTRDEIDQLVTQFKLDPGHMRDILDADEMPRLETDGDYTYIFMRYAYTNDELELTTTPILFVIGPELMISVSHRHFPNTQHFIDGKEPFTTSQSSTLFLQIVNQIVDQYEQFINNISHQIKLIRSQLRKQKVENQDFINFILIEDELNEFLSALTPATAILRRLLLGRHVSLHAGDKDLIEDLILNNEQLIEGGRSSVKSIVNIREAYSTIASTNLNRTMKILTAATVLIALPNVFFGMYGMNVVLPFAENDWAYFLVVGVTIIVTIAVVLLARARRVF